MWFHGDKSIIFQILTVVNLMAIKLMAVAKIELFLIASPQVD